MPPPTTEHWIKAANAFEELWNFPNCLGAIDGKHISIQCPPNAGSEYYNLRDFILLYFKLSLMLMLNL
jgi:hypothetical protein